MIRLTTVATICCEIDRSRSDLGGPLLRSIVHHQCTLADCDVETVDALEAAANEVVAELRRRRIAIVEISSGTGSARLDVRLELDEMGRDDAHAISTTLSAGPVVGAVRLVVDVDEAGRLRMIRRFDRAPE